MGDSIYYENKLSNLIQTLKVIESNDYLEDILENLDNTSAYYSDLEDLKDSNNDIEIDNKISEVKNNVEREILSILKMLY